MNLQQLAQALEHQPFVRLLPEKQNMEDWISCPIIAAGQIPFSPNLIELAAAGLKAPDTSDRLMMFRMFVTALEHGVYPPVAIMEWMRAGFATWLESGGNKSLDDAFAISTGRGKTPVFKKTALLARDLSLFGEMDWLMFYDATREEAAQLVAYRVEQQKLDFGELVTGKLSPETLADKHARAAPEYRIQEQVLKDHVASFPQRPLELLRDYDSIYMPERLRTVLKKASSAQ